MEYEQMAKELFYACFNTQRLETDRKINKILQGEAFALNFLFSHNNIAYPRELSNECKHGENSKTAKQIGK